MNYNYHNTKTYRDALAAAEREARRRREEGFGNWIVVEIDDYNDYSVSGRFELTQTR